MQKLSFDDLRNAVGRGGAAIRACTHLEPAGGTDDKLFPPTYIKEGRSETKYALEKRRIDGQETPCVLLDSVASQANRMEEALLDGWRRNELDFPLVEVDFSGVEGLEDLDRISSLQAPHRIADALLRDSLLGDALFRQSDVGQAFTDSRPGHATGMYKHCPTALVFGIWDSTGPKGGLGAKFQRCLVSEIVGINAIPGVRVESRIDRAGIEKKAGPIYQHSDPTKEWTTNPDEAAKDKSGNAILFSRKGAGDKGSPATINHGNIPPRIDLESGGVTIDHAMQTVVISLSGLRRLRFVQDVHGKPISPERRDDAETAARTTLAALALAAVVYQREQGYDLRSRCLLVARAPLEFELLSNEGGEPHRFSLSRDDAKALLKRAIGHASELGLGWDRGPVLLKPAPKLVHLIVESRKLKQAGEAE